jgi:hypothetical protein
MPSIATIERRVSVRTYRPEVPGKDVLGEFSSRLSAITDPFGVPVIFRLLDAEASHVSSPVIVGATTYLAAKAPRCSGMEEAFGYAFEQAVLDATDMGLSTVWLVATIDRPAFERAIDLGPDEAMPAVSPLGYAADKRSLRESVMRRSMKSDERLPFECLFFSGDFGHPLSESEAGTWKTPLEMVRKAPSATNKQPWRAVVKDGDVHFFEQKTRGYEKDGVDIQKVDLGIALCHFEVAATEVGCAGHIVREDAGLATPEDCEYIATWKREG